MARRTPVMMDDLPDDMLHEIFRRVLEKKDLYQTDPPVAPT